MIHFTEHAAKRAFERYGLVPTDAQWTRAALDIIDVVAGCGIRAMLLHRGSTTERWLVRIADIPVLAVWNPQLALIVTLLPPQWWERCGLNY